MAESDEDAEHCSNVDEQKSVNERKEVMILLNNSSKKRIQSNRIGETENNGKIVDIAISEVVPNKKLKRVRNSFQADEDSNVELDIIVVEESHRKDRAEKSEPSLSRASITETEPPTIQTNKSSPKPSKEVVIIQENPTKLHNNITSELLRPKTKIDGIVSSTEAFDANNEETYFALTLLGIMKRLSPKNRAIAKCHILSYLTELEYGPSSLT